MNKVAIVIGATGLIGSALVEKLIDAEHVSKIITLTRKPTNYSSPQVFNEVVDFENLQHYSELLKGDLLFSCLGTTLKEAGSIKAQRRVDLDYQLFAAQIAANNGVKHYLLVSSAGANQTSHRAYLKMKGELEQLVKSLPFQRISIFQPSLLIGHRKYFRWGEKIGAWLLPILCSLPRLKRYRPISGEQVATKMVQVSEKSSNALEFFCLDEIFLD